jgi:peptidoglycan/xylan/chitin deacetylase (PgdA/CDA1 family)
LVLAYHGIRPTGEAPAGEQALHLERSRFEEQLDVLGEVARVVPLDQILVPDVAVAPRPLVAITWDDAYAGAVTAGVDAVVIRGMPATIFVSPGRLGGQTFWWDRLAMQHGGSIRPSLRERILGELAGDEERVVREFSALPVPGAVPEWARTADEGTLARAASRRGITVASHSWSHVNLSAVDPERLAQELRDPLKWLRERFGGFGPWLSLPYGLGSATVRQRAQAAGYDAVLHVRGGWVPKHGVDYSSLPRLNIPAGLSLDAFVIRLLGFFCK